MAEQHVNVAGVEAGGNVSITPVQVNIGGPPALTRGWTEALLRGPLERAGVTARAERGESLRDEGDHAGAAAVAARAKWDRGVQDVEALEQRILELSSRHPYGVDVEFDRKTGWHTAYARIRELPPPDLSVLVGSAAYQFLSSLNLIVWDLAERKIGRHAINEGRVANDISFPIALKPADFESLRLVTRAYVSKKAVARLRGVQPYSGPNPAEAPRHPLVRLKPLADTDKHRVIAGTFGHLNYEGVQFVWDESVARDPTFQSLLPRASAARLVYDGTPLSRIRFKVGNAKVKVRVNHQPTGDIEFSDGRRMYSTGWLRAIAGATRWTIAYLTPLFPNEENPWGPADALAELHVLTALKHIGR